MSDALYVGKKMANIAMLIVMWFILIGIAIFSTPVRLGGELSERVMGIISDRMYDLENKIEDIQTQE
jgi:hypothetical protein